jgi:hypothetical protein
MAPDTIIMVVLICVGVALIIAGLVYVAITGARLAKAARKAGVNSMDDVRIIMRKAEGLAPRVREITEKQRMLAERMRSLSASAAKLNYLKSEFDRATGGITHLK